MAKDAIALIVVGSGETDEGEVFDLLEDAYPEDAYGEIGLVIPVDKDLHTKTVQNAVKWYGDDDNVYPIQTKGASMPRSATRLGKGNQMVEKFTDAINKDDFKEWDEVHVLLALPEDEDSKDYEFYAEIADLADQAGFKVKDLTAGLDDVVMTDPEVAEEPEAEPDPEPEKPARRSRRAAKAEEPAAEDPEEDEKAPTGRPRRSSRAAKAETAAEVVEAVKQAEKPAGAVEETKSDLLLRVESLESLVSDLQQILRNVGSALGASTFNVTVNTASTPAVSHVKDEDPAEAPKRGRGRPRTDFDIRQVWDEDDEDWVPRPKGRLKKGTKWRTIHAETDEVLEEGTA